MSYEQAITPISQQPASPLSLCIETEAKWNEDEFADFIYLFALITVGLTATDAIVVSFIHFNILQSNSRLTLLLFYFRLKFIILI